MIHKSSTDPVFIKKIELNIWTLRDEIEAIVGQKVKEKGSPLSAEEIEAIRREYVQESSPEVADKNQSGLLPKEKIGRGMCVLSEIEIGGLCFFAPQSYIEGQSIVLEFLIPKKFIVNAEVLHCRYFNMKGRIIGKNKLPYRVVVRFTFLKKGERALLRQFVESIQVKPATKYISEKGGKSKADQGDEGTKEAA